MGNIIRSGLVASIQFYRIAISSLLGHCCRFEPTCSAYSIDAVKKYGCCKGIRLSLTRLLKCHPWCAGGFDPLP